MIVVILDSNQVFIVVSLCTRTNTYVIYVDPTTDTLRHKAKLGFNLFKLQGKALDFITKGLRFAYRSKMFTRVILGYVKLEMWHCSSS